MFDFLTSPYFLLFARVCVGGVFMISSVAKMLDREGTAVSMSRYPFMPGGFGRFVAYTFPYGEMLVGLMLLLGLFTRAAAIASVAMFVLFTGLIVYDLSQGSDAPCHCFGRLSAEKLTPMAVVRNVVLLALSLLVFFAFDGWVAIDGALSGGLPWLVATTPSSAVQPAAVNAVPVILLGLAAVAVVALGGQAINTVRSTLRGLGFR